jgi:hypothetical protein
VLELGFVRPASDEIGVTGDDGEDVAEVVRDAAGEPADRLHPLGAAKLLLEPCALRHVDREHDARLSSLERRGVGSDLDLEDLAGLRLVEESTMRPEAAAPARLLDGLADARHLLRRTDVENRE